MKPWPCLFHNVFISCLNNHSLSRLCWWKTLCWGRKDPNRGQFHHHSAHSVNRDSWFNILIVIWLKKAGKAWFWVWERIFVLLPDYFVLQELKKMVLFSVCGFCFSPYFSFCLLSCAIIFFSFGFSSSCTPCLFQWDLKTESKWTTTSPW